MTTTTTTATTVHEALADLAGKLFVGGIDHVHVTVQIQPAEPGDTATVDRIAAALGVTAGPYEMANGNIHHHAGYDIGDVDVFVFTRIVEPVESRRARLTAELAALDAQIGATV